MQPINQAWWRSPWAQLTGGRGVRVGGQGEQPLLRSAGGQGLRQAGADEQPVFRTAAGRTVRVTGPEDQRIFGVPLDAPRKEDKAPYED